MSDVVAFISARLNEDEAVAQEVPPLAEWEDAEYGARFSSHDGDHFYADILFVTRHDPVRVLAQVEAMRRIVALHSGWVGICAWTHDSSTSHNDEPPCDTICALATIWSTHPDFDPAWRSSPE